MVSTVGRKYGYGGEVTTGQRQEFQVARVSPYANESLAVTAELEVFATLKHLEEFKTEVLRVIAISADNGTKWAEQIKLAGLDEQEITWELGIVTIVTFIRVFRRVW